MSLIERFFPDAVIPSSLPEYWGVSVEFNNYRKRRPGYTAKPRPLVEFKKDPGHKSPWGDKVRDQHPRMSLRVGPVRIGFSWRAADDVCVDEYSGCHVGCTHENGTRENAFRRSPRVRVAGDNLRRGPPWKLADTEAP